MALTIELQNDAGLDGVPGVERFHAWVEAALQRDYAALEQTIRVVDETGRNDVLGARVEVVLPDRRAIWRTVRTAASYLSSNDPRVLVGLGGRTSVAAVRVHWPGGAIEEWTDPAVGRYLVLKRGAGRETDR